MHWLTLKRLSVPPPPDPQSSEVRVYADEDGVIRSVDHEGNDDPVGGEGGGSQPFKAVAFDFDVSDVNPGAVLLYTPQAGEFALGAVITAFTPLDVGSIAMGVLTGLGTGGEGTIYAKITNSPNKADIYNGGSVTQAPTTDPLYASVLENIGIANPWQAATNYDVDGEPQSNVIAAGHLWFNGGSAGVSGSVEPDFAGNIGGDVADGADIVWSDQGVLAGTGAMTGFVIVAAPS